jgi:TRAP-type transport system periplasmic protein
MKNSISKIIILVSLLLIGSVLLSNCTPSPVSTTPAPATTSAAPTTQVQAPMNLNYSFGGANSGVFAETSQWFCNELTKRTDGKIVVTVHWGGTLIKQPDTLVSVGKGVADIGAAMGTPTVAMNPHMTTLGAVGAGKDPWATTMAVWEMMNNNPKILAEYDKHNVVPTHGYFPGTPVMFLRKEIKSVNDLKGLRIRAGSPDDASILPKLGIEPVNVQIFDLYDSMSKGVIDGCMLTIAWGDTLKWGEVAKYWYQPTNNLIGGDVTSVINKDVWNKFTPQTREIVKTLAREYNDKYVKGVMDQEVAALEKVKTTLKVQYQPLPEDANKIYQSGMASARQAWFDKWDSQGNTTKAVFDEYQGLIEKYQKQVADKGYPWGK